MKRLLIAISLVPALASAGQAAEDGRAVEAREVEAYVGFEQVESFTAMTGLDSWTVLDDDSLIVWATPFRPYLIELSRPSHDLKFAQAIGVTQFGNQVHARFDSVRVRGLVYPIDRIYKLSRDEAREMNRSF